MEIKAIMEMNQNQVLQQVLQQVLLKVQAKKKDCGKNILIHLIYIGTIEKINQILKLPTLKRKKKEQINNGQIRFGSMGKVHLLG